MKKLFFGFILGTFLSLILITLPISNLWISHDLKLFIPYIGTAILGGICISCLRDNDDRIFKLENEIKELKEKL